ncbi:MAG: LemA family protein [Candidatus Aenigmarchaeota archaeon]|nr:LemA family protein [Candidatus Aenigmarchaeota archaeon]
MLETILFWGAIIVVVIAALYLFSVYNGLIRKKNRVENAWAQIDVQLKRRTDLIPNLVSSVKGYMKHEKSVLTELTKARSAIMKATSPGSKAKASSGITSALKSLFAVAENYPNLKANENFMHLQEELSGTENKIAYSRQHYNDSVMEFNISIQVFPNRVFAKRMGFGKKEMFDVPEADKKPVKVEF